MEEETNLGRKMSILLTFSVFTLLGLSSNSALELTSFRSAQKLSSQLHIASETVTFRIRYSVAQLCRADPQRQHYRIPAHQHSNFEFPTLLDFNIQTCVTFQTREQSHASEFPLTSLVVCNSFKLVMDSASLEFMYSPSFDVVHIQRFPCGSSCTENNDLLQLGRVV